MYQSVSVALGLVLCPFFPCTPCPPAWSGQWQAVLSLEGGRRGARVFLPVTSALGGISGSGCASSMVLAAPRGPRLRPPSSPPTGVLGTVPHCLAALGIRSSPFVPLALGLGWVLDIGDH